MTVLSTDIEEQHTRAIGTSLPPPPETETPEVPMAAATAIPTSSDMALAINVPSLPSTSSIVPMATGHPPTVTVPDRAMVSIQDLPKQGKKCCGCCCDFRRAVIIVNIVSIVVNLLVRARIVEGISALIGVAFSIIAIVGANKYNIYMVGANILWMLVVLAVDAILPSPSTPTTSSEGDETTPTPVLDFVISAILMALFIYPHAGFIHEVKMGILTEETYPREYYS